MSNALEVWLDFNLMPQCQVGMLYNNRGVVRFEYDKGWLHPDPW